MAQSKITLIGLYNYYLADNRDLFANLTLPTGIDKTDVVNNILLKGGEFEILYSNPEFMENMMVLWSNKNRWTFERWLLALTEEYNPLHNFDRHEEYKDTKTGDEAINRVTQNSTTNNESITKDENVTALDHSISTGRGDTTNTVSAYDSSTYQPHDKAETSSVGDNTSTATTDVAGNQTTSGTSDMNGVDNSNRITSETLDHNAHLFGNIGLTTSQQMASDEIKLRRDYNLYDLIADLFISEFCIYTY